MDSFSSSVTAFHVPKPFTPNPHHRLKPTPLSPQHHHHLPSSAAKTTVTSSLSTFPRKDNFNPIFSHYPRKTPSTHLNLKPPRSSIHRRAASGYAAALLDISQCNGTVLKVERDVRRLLRLLRDDQVKDFMRDELVEEREKGKVVKELVEMGKFEGHLVGLVNMVVDKGKRVELLKEALEEFLRVFSQLSMPHIIATSC